MFVLSMLKNGLHGQYYSSPPKSLKMSGTFLHILLRERKEDWNVRFTPPDRLSSVNPVIISYLTFSTLFFHCCYIYCNQHFIKCALKLPQFFVLPHYHVNTTKDKFFNFLNLTYLYAVVKCKYTLRPLIKEAKYLHRSVEVDWEKQQTCAKFTSYGMQINPK